jgi:hypothetical protein
MYKTKFANGMVRTYNLRNINMVELNKTKVVMTFNACRPNGFFMLGSGNLDCEFQEEKITFNDEKQAEKEFEEISLAISKLN